MKSRKSKEHEKNMDNVNLGAGQTMFGLLEEKTEPSVLDPDLQSMFDSFGDRAKKFSEEMQELITPRGRVDSTEMSKVRLYLARTIFSKWSIEILTVLYGLRSAGYSDIKGGVGKITSRILSQKLKLLEKAGLIERSVIATRPPTVRYSLTDKGINVARIAEPVFLYGAAIEHLYQRPKFLLEKI
jgi:DNA-binding HxlR family transcriptional regulator